MILLFQLLLFSNIHAKFYDPLKIVDMHQFFYSIPTSDLKMSCSKAKNDYCICSLEVKNPGNQSWVFRRTGGEFFCKEFQAKIKKIFKQSKQIEIFGYGTPGTPQSEYQYIGAIRNKNTCWEWFNGDCANFKTLF